MHVRSKNFESSKPSISLGKVMRGGKIFEVENKFADLIEGSRRELFEVNSYNKRTGIKINEIYHKEKWISLSDYQILNNNYDFSNGENIEKNKKSLAAKNVIRNFTTYISDSYNKIKNNRVENILNIKEENFSKREILNLSSTEFQEFCVRKLFNNTLLSIEKRVAGGKIMSDILVDIGHYVNENIEKENERRLKKGESIITEGQYHSILEAGIEAAFIYADIFVKNKKQNEELCTNDYLDHQKVDFEEVELDENENIKTVYFTQIKSNRERALIESKKIFEGMSKYVEDTLSKVGVEEFKKTRSENMRNSFNENKRKSKNILFAENIIGKIVYVDIKNKSFETLATMDLTFL